MIQPAAQNITNYITLLKLHIRSLRLNQDVLQTLKKTITQKPDVVALTETSIAEQEHAQGYNI